ncbi:MAG: BadF/BadG/BcrA/BcrD ATPase family protein [Eubacteriales bacterium]
MDKKYLIGIDGGGTKTELALCRYDGSAVKTLLAAATNACDTGFEAARNTLFAAIDALISGIDQGEIGGLFAGLSGGITGDNKRLFSQALHERYSEIPNIANDSDIVNALSSGIPYGDGGVVISGTGSVAYERSGGKMRRIGGWGYLIDRGGSGYDLGRDALYASLCYFDGRGPETSLKAKLEHTLGAPIDIAVGEIYKKGKTLIASLAPLVFEAYSEGDDVARAVVGENVRELCRLIRSIKAEKIVLAGGIFSHRGIMLPEIERALGGVKYDFIFPAAKPVFGAVAEAAKLCGIRADDDFTMKWQDTYK